MANLAEILFYQLFAIIFVPSSPDPSAWHVTGLVCLMALFPLMIARAISR